MFALRQVQPINGEFITIRLPVEFRGCTQAEVIVLPVENKRKTQETTAFIAQFAGSIPDFPEIEPLSAEKRDAL
jgi:hypothetical protein